MRVTAAWLLGAALLAGCGTTVPPGSLAQAPADSSGVGSVDPVGEQPPGLAAPPTTGVTAGPDGTSQPVAPRGPGRAPSSAPVGSAPGVAAPSVRTTTPIVVGVLGIKRVAELASAAGVSTGQTFAPTEAFQVAAKRFGGSIQGRKLSVVVAEIDPSSGSYSSDYEAACERLVRDGKAAVVLSLDVIGVEQFSACLGKAGVPQINTGYSGFDRDGHRRYPHVVGLTSPDIDSRVRAVVTGSQAAGRLPNGARVGVVVEECGGNERAYDRSLLPALRAAGAQVTRFAVSCIDGAGGLGSAISSLSGAVLQFQAAGVTRVTFASNFEGALLLGLTAQSESQGFRPTYLLSSTAGMTSALPNIAAGQRPGLTGVGWMPSMDTSAGAAPTTVTQRACLAAIRAAGLDPSGHLDALASYSACDAFALLDAVLARTGGATSLPAFRAALAEASSALPTTSVLKESVRVSAERPNGPVLVRPWQWLPSCECLRYTGAELAL